MIHFFFKDVCLKLVHLAPQQEKAIRWYFIVLFVRNCMHHQISEI